MLRDKLGGFEAVGSKFHAVAVLFEHAADEFADTNGVVGDDDDAFLIHAVDGFGGDGAASDGSGTGSKNARSAGGGLHRAALAGVSGDHAVKVDEQNEAAIGSDGGAGEEFHAAEIFAKVFDHDFVFAENFLNDDANLAIAGAGDDHAEVAVDGFKRRQA